MVLSIGAVLLVGLQLSLCWLFYVTIFRLFFHPLAQISGPRLAAITDLYRFYYTVIRRGDLLNHLKDLHKIYGPTIRIGPNEVHFADSNAYFDIYHSRDTEKEAGFYEAFFAPDGSLASSKHTEAKVHRKPLLRLLSRRETIQKEGLLTSKAEQLCKLLSASTSQQEPVDTGLAFRCFALDAATDFVFGFTFDSLKSAGFQCPILAGQDCLLAGLWLQANSSWIRGLTNLLSPWSLGILYPQSLVLFEKMNYLQALLDDLLRQETDDHKGNSRIPLFETLTTPGELGRVPLRSYTAIISEAFTMIFGAAYAVGITLTMATYYTTRNRKVLSNLRAELETIWPESKEECPPWTTLERLPYLSAVVKETLRITGGVSTGAPRITPLGGIEIAGDHFPQGITVSSSNYFPNHDKNIFEEPEVFCPERWITGGKEMQKWELAFSVGPRQCPAITYSEAALHICLAHIVRSFDLDYPDRGHIKYKDYFVPLVDGPQMRAQVKKRH